MLTCETSQGDFRTNMAPEDVNAVTWAVFPGKEIVQSTIIEEVSFVSWKVRPVSSSFYSWPGQLITLSFC